MQTQLTTDYWGYLSARGFKRRGNEAEGTCPACSARHRQSLSVNLSDGRWICNRQDACGQKGGWRDLLRLFGDDVPRTPTRAAEVVYLPVKRSATALKPNGREFLHGRGLTDAVIDAWRIGQEGDWLAWPVYDGAEKLVNVKYRHVSEKQFRNQKGTARWPIGVHRCHGGNGKRLIVTEGELDAMSAEQFGLRNVVSLPNGSGDQDWIKLSWDWLTDDDEAGRKARAEIIRRLGHDWTLRTVVLPDGHKDLNACLMAGVPAEAITAAFDAAAVIRPEAVRRPAEYLRAVLDRLNDTGRIVGARSGLPKLDDLLRGFRPGGLTVWTGPSGSGKSTVIGMLALNWWADRYPSCFASFELPPPAMLAWLVKQAAGSGRPSDAEATEALRWIDQGLTVIDHHGSADLEKLLGWFAYCAKRHGCRHFVADNLQLIRAGNDEHAAQGEITRALVGFANTYGVHVHLVTHVRKGESDGQEPDKVDVKGNSTITDLAHNVVAVYRVGAFTWLKVLKNREHGLLGKLPIAVDADSKQVFDSSVSPPDFSAWIAAANDDPDDIPAWED
jgi:KaiC/GvpD/RAD55 family RecA-like ATPase